MLTNARESNKGKVHTYPQLPVCTQCGLQFQILETLNFSLGPTYMGHVGGWVCQSRRRTWREEQEQEQGAVAAAIDVDPAGAALFCKGEQV